MKKRAGPRRFQQNEALRVALFRQKFALSGSISTVLLETFLENDGRILASKVVARGICEEGKFREWRKELIDKEWLKWSENQDDKGQYYPGKKLLPYINKEKLSSKEIVTKDEVLSKNEAATKLELDDVKEKLAKTDERLSKVENSMVTIYKKLDLGEPDPPFYKKLQQKVIPNDDRN